ncbi:hypothetical protein SCUCBS95973_001809 [Sporothrix curviconia]|uniref:Transcription factor domain-containing protein n=1 Tax=Sporothrix curviconia TaxID=1260050 RepID=A0ABP0B1S1_9PEZI
MTCRTRKKRCFHTAADKADRVNKAAPTPASSSVSVAAVEVAVDPPAFTATAADIRSGITTRDSSPKPGRSIDYIPEVALTNLSGGDQGQDQDQDHDQDHEQDLDQDHDHGHDQDQDHDEPVSYNEEAQPRPGSKESPDNSNNSNNNSARSRKRAPPHPTKRRLSDVKRAQRQLAQFYRKHRPRNAPVILSDAHRNYLDEAGALLELPRTTADALLAIYVSLLDDLIPIVDGASVFRRHSNGQTSIYLIRAICLVACKTKQAAPFLRLYENGPVLAPLDFAARLLGGLDAAIKADLEPDRITKVQILGLMHLHNDGTTGTRRAASCLAQAVSEAWSLSLHWQIPGNNVLQDQATSEVEYLWWSLRNFDRLSKPIMAAAPFQINDSDVGLPRITPRPDSYRSQIMAVATVLGDLLATATMIFKATCKATVDDCQDFPSFARITADAQVDLELFHHSHRAYLEIWYCVAAMLSCRYSGPGSGPYQRRFDAAMRVLDLITDGKHETLPPLPVVPYAMSMSTTIVYRALRDKQINAATAQRDMTLCCEALDGLARLWTSVAGVAKLARRLLRLLGRQEAAQRSKKDTGPEQDLPPPPLPPPPRQPPLLAELAELQSNSSNTSQTSNISSSSTAVPGTMHAPMPTITSTAWQPYPDFALGYTNGDGVNATAVAAPPPPPMDFETQLSTDWDGSPGTYPQLDAAFHDLFDFAIPTGFREQETWAFFPHGTATAQVHGDGSSTGSEFTVGPVNTSQLY